MPFHIGDRVECIKSDDRGTWYAARVVDISSHPDPSSPGSSADPNGGSPDAPSSDPLPDETFVFVHYEGWPLDHAEWVRPSSIRVCGEGDHQFLRYGALGAEDEKTWRDMGRFYYSPEGRIAQRHTGLAFDKRMLGHACPCRSEKTTHPERPERLSSILVGLHRNG